MRVAKKILIFCLRISVSLALLVFLFHKARPEALRDIAAGADKRLLSLGLCLTAMSYCLCFLRWRMLLLALGVHVSAVRMLSAYGASLFFGILLPSTVGGDVVRSLDLAAETKKTPEVVASVLLDRLSGFTGMALMGMAALCIGTPVIRDAGIALFIILLAAALAAVLVAIFHTRVYALITRVLHREKSGRIRSALVSIHQHMHRLRQHPKKIVLNVALSLTVQLITPIVAYLVALACGVKINLVLLFIFFPIITVVTMLPVSIAGLGLRDIAAVTLFAKAGLSANIAVAVSLSIFGFTVVCSTLGGLAYVFTVHHRRV